MCTGRLNNLNKRQIVLNVADNKYNFFMELLKNFDFVQIDDNQGDSKEEIVANLSQAFKELKLIKEEELQSRPVEEFLNTL